MNIRKLLKNIKKRKIKLERKMYEMRVAEKELEYVTHEYVAYIVKKQCPDKIERPPIKKVGSLYNPPLPDYIREAFDE